MKHKLLIILLIILALAVLGAGCRPSAEPQEPESAPAASGPDAPPPESGESDIPEESAGEEAEEDTADKIVAPDFTVYDGQGNAVSLSDFLGKPVVLNFWASWCGPCKGEMPDFQAVYEELGEDVHFLIVNLTDGERETVESASEFIASQGYTFPVYFDTTSEAAYAYGIRSIPTTFFIDAEGCAIAQATGAIDAETLQKGIDMILPQP